MPKKYLSFAGLSRLLDFLVPINRKVNGKSLDNDVTLNAVDVDAEPTRLKFVDTPVTTDAWTADATYDGYSVRKAVTLAGVTAAMMPDVVFAPAEAGCGNFAQVAASYAGGVYLYAKDTPSATFTIPSITLWR